MIRRTRWGLIVVSLWVFIACAIPIPTTAPLTKIDMVDETQSVGLDGAQRAVVRLRLLSQRLAVRPGDDVGLLLGRFRYNVKEWAPSVKQNADEGTTTVTVGQGLGSQIPLGKSDDGYVNEWDVGLAYGVPIDLGVDIGVGQVQLDLGGLSLSDLSVTSGSADVSLTFDAPNPEPLGHLRLTSGTGTFVVSGLGNANFDHLSVLGGTGRVNLDFSGAQSRSAVVDIKAGAGKIDLRVPASVGTRVTLTGTGAGTVDIIGFTEQSDKVYVNAAYGVAALTLTINVTIGVGAITLISQ